MDFLKKYAGIAVLLLLIGGAYFFPKSSTVSFGSAIPSTPAVFETYLANSQGSTDTSFTLASASLRDGTSLSGYNCFTIDSNTPTLEYECGTVSGTTVSNVTRGIDAVTGTTTVASLQFAHRRGADVKITDYPLLTILGRMANGQDTYPNLLQYANTVLINSLSASTTLATKYYVDQTAVSGAPNATPTVKGIVQFATGLQAASSTATGSTGALLALGNGIATDTPSVPQSVSGSHVIMSTIGGFLNQAWLNLSDAFTWTGNHIFNGTLTANATTTIAASSVTNNALSLNGIAYAFPPTQSASSTVLSTNGSGQLYWTNAPVGSYVGTTISTSTATGGPTPASYSSNTTFTTTFQPTTIVLYISGAGFNSTAIQYLAGINVFNGTSCVGGLQEKNNSAGTAITVPSDTAIGCSLQVGQSGYTTYTVSITSVTSTGFTVNIAYSTGYAANTVANISVSPVAYR